MELTQRQKSIKMIQDAYNKGKLGFQKRAKDCLYYDPNTESFCAVGVLVCNGRKRKKEVRNPFKNCKHQTISTAMKSLGLDEYKGLTIDELAKLQELHDQIINTGYYIADINFKNYLFSLK